MYLAPDKTFMLLNSPMQALSMEETVNIIDQQLTRGHFVQHVVVNVAKLVHMQNNEELRNSVECCDIINIDGMGVVWGARFLGHEIPERVAGIDLFMELIGLSEQKSYPIFLLGAKPEIVEKTAEALQQKHPLLNIAGFHHGYFWENEEEVVNKINESGAKLLFVAISSPQKENFINKWKSSLGVDFAMGVGGSFDVIAGKTKRAPAWMQEAGLEWFYRLAQEPFRLWRRYLSTNALFTFALIKEKLKRTRGTNFLTSKNRRSSTR